MSTKLVAEQFEISRRRVQQLAREYRDTGSIPEVETPGRMPYATHPDDLSSRVVAVHGMLGCGAGAVGKVLRVRDDLSVATNTVHEILTEHDTVTENTNKQGRQRPWVRFERDHSVVTVHMDWFRNERNQQVLAIEDDASRYVFDMIETDSQSAARSVELLTEIRAEYETDVPILEVITDHGSEFVDTSKDDRPSLDHEFERYLHEHEIEHSLCKVGCPQSNGKLERFFRTYEKHRWRFDTLEEFLHFYNEVRPHMSLLWDELETPAEAFDRLLPMPDDDFEEALTDGGDWQ